VLRIEVDAELGRDGVRRADEDELGALVVEELGRVDGDPAPSPKRSMSSDGKLARRSGSRPATGARGASGFPTAIT
jgi:hypothetical protein